MISRSKLFKPRLLNLKLKNVNSVPHFKTIQTQVFHKKVSRL